MNENFMLPFVGVLASYSPPGDFENPHAEFFGPVRLPDDHPAGGSLGLFTGVLLRLRLGIVDDLHFFTSGVFFLNASNVS
jgi:hypothetical protein